VPETNNNLLPPKLTHIRPSEGISARTSTPSPSESDAEPGMNWSEILTGELLICSLIGKAIYVYPEKAWLQSLIDEQVFAETPFGSGNAKVDAGLARLQEWSEEQHGALTQASFDAVEVDYVRLFIGSKKMFAPPWESVYLNKDHLLFQKETLQVRNWYRRFGLQVEHLYNQPDDHLGIEFSFLAHLARLSLQALEMGDQPEFEKLRKAQREFIRTHMDRWVPRWNEDVQANGHTLFYQGIAQLAHGVLETLKTVLEPPPPDEGIR